MATDIFLNDTLLTYMAMAEVGNYNLVLATQSGVIIGNPNYNEDKEQHPELVTFFELFDNNRKSVKGDFLQSITLVDVTFIVGGKKTKLPSLTIFVDKIIGISIAESID